MLPPCRPLEMAQEADLKGAFKRKERRDVFRHKSNRDQGIEYAPFLGCPYAASSTIRLAWNFIVQEEAKWARRTVKTYLLDFIIYVIM